MAALVGEGAGAVVAVAAAATAAAGQVAYPMLAADGVAAIVPGPVLVLGDGIDLSIQHLTLMAEAAATLAAEAEEEIEGLAPGGSRTGGEIEHEAGMAA